MPSQAHFTEIKPDTNVDSINKNTYERHNFIDAQISTYVYKGWVLCPRRMTSCKKNHTQPESIHAQVSQHMRNDFKIFLRVGLSLADLSEDSLRLWDFETTCNFRWRKAVSNRNYCAASENNGHVNYDRIDIHGHVDFDCIALLPMHLPPGCKKTYRHKFITRQCNCML